MDTKTCELFLKVDVLFDDGEPNLAKINKQFGKFMRDCPYDKASAGYKCQTGLEGIKGLCSHLLAELFKRSKRAQKRENDHSQYVEYVMMWLGYRLFQTESYSSSTLIDFYNNYLMKSYILNDYSDLIMKRKHLKDADLYYMNRFYQLVQQICYITLVYSKNISNVHGIKNDSTIFYNMYTRLYNDINECDSYLNLLNNLKTQYENLRKSLINNSRSSRRFLKGALITNFKDLPATKKKKKTTTIGFDCETCKKVSSNAKKKPSKPAPKAQEPAIPKPPTSTPTATQLTLQPQPQQAEQQPSPVSPEKPEKSKIPASPSSESSQREKQPPLPPPEQPPASIETNQKGSPDSQDVPNAAGDQLSNQENTPKGSDSDQHNLASKTKEQGDGTVDKPKQSQDAQQETSSPKHGNSSSGSENSDSLRNSDPKLPTNELKKQQSQSDSTHQPEKKEPSQPESKNGTESKNTQAEGSSHSSGEGNSKTESKGLESSKPNTGDETDDTGSSRTGSKHLDGGSSDQGSGNSTEDKKGPQIDQTNQLQTSGTNKEGSNGDQGNTNNDPLKGGGEQGGQDDQKSQGGPGDSGTGPGSDQNPKDSDPGEKGSQNIPGDPFNTGPFAFKIISKGMEQLNNAFKFYEEKKEQLTKAKDTIKNLYNTSVSNIKNYFEKSIDFFSSIIDNVNSDSKQVDIPTNLDSNQPESKDTGNKLPTSNDSPPSQENSHQKDSPPKISLLPSSMEQTQTQQSPQDPSGNKNSDQIDQGGLQKSMENQGVKTENSGTEIKGNGTGIGDILLKKYKTIGISIIVLLISITLAIMYKYLSSGWRKELKKKKNMKKVISSIGGKRQVQIIINSSSQKRQTKKSINSVYGGKFPLLNVYKLMQADPVPFINLFFLLIFFVYKRKDNSLE
ncbi:PIR protein CIR protein [Plasmodium vinckei lentum]|uniref:PIR protein CIR protein n=1 Tax=Plasmodium vinckei lentum TaxID=138297 RepID=A0A6V7SKM2_PLAVN|nr:PIR protein CIR protein [Plasmodium vinckei lentum]